MKRTLYWALFAVVALLAIAVVGCSDSDDSAAAGDDSGGAATVEDTGTTDLGDRTDGPVKEKEEAEEVVVEATAVPEVDSKFGGVLKVVSQASVASLDPIFSGAYVTTAIASHLSETLFAWDINTQDAPALVDTWEISDDNMTYTFTIRDSTFHDGSTVTTADVKATYIRIVDSWYALWSTMREFIDASSFTIVDDKTFKLELKEPTGAIVMALGKPYGSPRSCPESVCGGVDAFQAVDAGSPEATWIGTGPYKFKEWIQGDRIVLERYDDYKASPNASSLYTGEQIAYIDEIHWLEVPDEETKIAGLETGEWDVVDGAGLDFYDRLSKNSGLQIATYTPGHRSNLLTPANPPFDSPEGRQALQTGLDIEAIMYSLGPNNLWRTCHAVFYCDTRWETDAGSENYNRNDKEAAKELLAQAGYAGETLVVLNPTDYATITPTGYVVKQEMEAMGIVVDMPANDWATIVSKFGNPEQFALATSWDVHWNSTSPLEHEAIGANSPLFPVDLIIDGSELHQLRKQFAQATDPAEQMRLVDAMQLEFYRVVPAVYEGIFYSIYPATAALKGFNVKAFPWYVNSWLER